MTNTTIYVLQGRHFDIQDVYYTHQATLVTCIRDALKNGDMQNGEGLADAEEDGEKYILEDYPSYFMDHKTRL